MNFYDKYIETVTKNDERTRLSVDAIMGYPWGCWPHCRKMLITNQSEERD